MYTITVKKFGENEPFMMNAPTKEIACQIGLEVAHIKSDECDIEKLVITLDQSKHYVKSQNIYLKYGYKSDLPDDLPCEETEGQFDLVFTHTLDFFDWRNN